MATQDSGTGVELCTGDYQTNPGTPDYKNIEIWNQNWGDDFCFRVFDNIMFQGADRQYSGIALTQNVQPAMQLILNRFNGMYELADPDNRPILIPLDRRKLRDSLQSRILSACRKLPGACDTFLTGPLDTEPKTEMQFPMSAPFCQNLTRNQIADTNTTLQFCGCFSPPIVSEKVRKEIGDKSCDPLCQRIDTVQLPDGKGGFLECSDNTVCVINAISITAAKTEVGGSVNFEQICDCKNNCRCVIESESDIEKTLSEIGLSGNFEQLCGQNSACVLFNPKTNIDTFVTCPESTNGGGSNTNQDQKTVILFWSIGVILVVVILIIVLFVSLNVKNKSVK